MTMYLAYNKNIANVEERVFMKALNDMNQTELMSRVIELQSTIANMTESKNRLVRNLKVEYNDFQDAIGMEMSEDLGENMRIQLQTVFRLLKKGGFEL
jgi:hypothetical protein